MKTPAPDGLSFEFRGERFTGVLDWAAIAFFERESGASLVEFVTDHAAGKPKLSHLAWLLQAVLQRHHAGIDFESCGEMAFDSKVQVQLFELTGAAMPQDSGDVEELGNVPAGASKPKRRR